ncbi:MAG: sigma-70 family RNA polymerase sigma factor [Kiritimatiellae bacterium]|nr:sigma-70 family RNA polymerase sigma factor [Kiritimatiellia bacterium]
MDKTLNTSITLLNTIAKDAESARWAEFFVKYESAMRGFLKARYPSVEADDVIQETMRTLVRILPGYRYTPDVKGHFRNYLMGIVKHKAEDALRKRRRSDELNRAFGENQLENGRDHRTEDEENEWREAAMETAIEQLMSNPDVNPRDREIFRHVALMREAPESVAEQFGVSRGNVDVIKSRMIRKLTALVTLMLDE